MTPARRLAAAAVAAAVLAIVTPAAPASAMTAEAPTAKPRVLRPCPSEDAAGVRACVWDARHMGNGKGRPFLWVRASGGRVVFLTHRQAHSLLRWGA